MESVLNKTIKSFEKIKLLKTNVKDNKKMYHILVNKKKIILTYPRKSNCIYFESNKKYDFINELNSLIFDYIDDINEEKIIMILEKLYKITSLDKDKNINESNEYDDIYNDGLYNDNFDLICVGTNDENNISLEKEKEKWKKKEIKLRKIMKKNEKKINVTFSKQGSSSILTNDLIKAIKSNGKTITSPIDDNIFNWKVQFREFEELNLQKKLNQLNHKYGYDYIEIEFNFEMDLYPFYPPTVKINKPRLENNMMSRIATLDLLKFSSWVPTHSMVDVIQNIRDLIEKYGEINVNNPRNSIEKQSYLNIEYELLNLSLLTDINPRVNNEYISNKKVSKTLKKKKSKNDDKYWKSGVGYGYNGRNDWDINAYVQAEREKNNNIAILLENILTEIKKNSNEDYFLNIIEGSSLIPVIESYLKGSTILEMSKHICIYETIINIIKEFTNDNLIHLMDSLSNQKESLYEIIESLSNEVQVFINTITKNQNVENFTSNEKKEINLANEIIQVYNVLQIKFKDYIDKINQMKKDTIEKQIKDLTLEEKYKESIKNLQFGCMEIKEDYTLKKMGSESNLTRKGIMRIGKELCVFQKSLPLSLSSSVFLRTDNRKANIIRFIVTGPEDTPYSNGCFLFNLVMKSDFPNEPPKCILLTTGRGEVRFNPNLYNCGKVCLSLLGTWSGSGGEKWNKDTSTLLQLLVSIQSLIFVPNPYFNEPGYESEMNTSYGKKQNDSYNDNIRYRNMQWAILDQLQNPSKGFEQVIKTHFKIKKDKILEECGKWVEESKSYKDEMKNVYNEIKDKLLSLD